MRVVLSGSRQFGRSALELLLGLSGVEVVQVVAPAANEAGDACDRLRDLAGDHRLPLLLPEILTGETVKDADLLVSAHSHAFISRRVRLRMTLGAIGYHPSLLPLHRGRDAVRWAIHMGDRVTGGSVYWLTDNVDAGPIAAQRHCLIRPDDTPQTLWRRELFPVGIKLLGNVIRDILGGTARRDPQDEELATWEPSWERAPLRRTDLRLLPPAGGFTSAHWLGGEPGQVLGSR